MWTFTRMATSAVDSLKNVREALAEGRADELREPGAPEDDDMVYRNILLNLQFEQLKLFKEFRSMLEQKESQISKLKETCEINGVQVPADMVSDETEEEEAEHDKGNVLNIDGRHVKLQQAMEVADSDWELKMKRLIEQKTDTEAKLLAVMNKVKKLEVEREEFAMQLKVQKEMMKTLGEEKDNKSTEDKATIENLVMEYSKLSSDAEERYSKLENEVKQLKEENAMLQSSSSSATAAGGGQKSKEMTQEVEKVRELLERGKEKVAAAESRAAEAEQKWSEAQARLRGAETKLREIEEQRQNEMARSTEATQQAASDMDAVRHKLEAAEGKLEQCAQEIARLSREKEEITRKMADQVQALQAELQKSREESQREREQASATLEERLRACKEDGSRALEEGMASLRSELECTFAREREELEAAHASQLKNGQEEREKAERELIAEHEAHLKHKVDQAVQECKAQLETTLNDLKATQKSELERALSELEARKDAEQQKLTEAHNQQRQKLQKDLEDATEAAEKQKELLKQEAEREKEEALKKVAKEHESELKAAKKETETAWSKYCEEKKERRKIHNKLLEIQGNIRVYCRVRPVLPVDEGTGAEKVVTFFPVEGEIEVQSDGVGPYSFEFDQVFSPSSQQVEVYKEVQPLIVSAMDGYNVCIFAYGQTGSGKTHTMSGPENDRGVNFRALEDLFVMASQRGDMEYEMKISMLEIYNETIRDLLLPPPKKGEVRKGLEIRQTKQDGIAVPDLTEATVKSLAEVAELMNEGNKNRAVGAHDMNEHSSRSHMILCVKIRGTNIHNQSVLIGKLNLIDLAGSERVSKTEASGERLKEAQNINRSLSALGDVIAALGDKKKGHVPFRNSKLTFLLQDSMSGNSKVLMFVNTSPVLYNYPETLCSLNFASRCRATELGQARKQVESGEVRRLQKQVEELKLELKQQQQPQSQQQQQAAQSQQSGIPSVKSRQGPSTPPRNENGSATGFSPSTKRKSLEKSGTPKS